MSRRQAGAGARRAGAEDDRAGLDAAYVGLIYGSRGNRRSTTPYRGAKIGNRADTNAEFVTRLGELPLRFPPGTSWEYGVSIDVLGRLVEVVAGKTLGEFSPSERSSRSE